MLPGDRHIIVGCQIEEAVDRRRSSSFVCVFILQATEEEISSAVDAALSETGITSIKQMGVVMKAAQAKLAGLNADGQTVSELVKSKLSG